MSGPCCLQHTYAHHVNTVQVPCSACSTRDLEQTGWHPWLAGGYVVKQYLAWSNCACSCCCTSSVLLLLPLHTLASSLVCSRLLCRLASRASHSPCFKALSSAAFWQSGILCKFKQTLITTTSKPMSAGLHTLHARCDCFQPPFDWQRSAAYSSIACVQRISFTSATLHTLLLQTKFLTAQANSACQLYSATSWQHCFVLCCIKPTNYLTATDVAAHTQFRAHTMLFGYYPLHQ